MNINCPLCQIQMEPKRGKCKYGTDVRIDQCPQCGGIWGDKWEFYRVNPDQAATLVEVDEEKFEKKVPPHGELSCPRCSSILEKIRDPFIPDDIDLETCIRCGGIWTKAGTFLRYKQWRGEKMKVKETPEELQELKNQIEELLVIQHHKERQRGEAIGKIGQFLGKRVGPGGINIGRIEWKEHEKRWFAIIVVIIVILSAIFARIIERVFGR